QFGAEIEAADGSRDLRPGQVIRFRADLENPLTAGRYFLHCGVAHSPTRTVILHLHSCLDFVVFGGGGGTGVVDLPHEVSALAEDGDGGRE
ncbi:MAG TPA: hypothetical protein VF259_05770, partial [Solirubrobacterales bacterium]